MKFICPICSNEKYYSHFYINDINKRIVLCENKKDNHHMIYLRFSMENDIEHLAIRLKYNNCYYRLVANYESGFFINIAHPIVITNFEEFNYKYLFSTNNHCKELFNISTYFDSSKKLIEKYIKLTLFI